MKVILAKTAGFCEGVQRAVKMVNSLCNKNPIYTYGELIHNPEVAKELKEKNVHIIENYKLLEENSTVVIRTHGIPPQQLEEMKRLNLNIKNATCPKVSKIQSIVQKAVKDENFVVIIGDEGHPEVNAHFGYTQGHGTVISTEKQLEHFLKTNKYQKLFIVGQSTTDEHQFKIWSQKIQAVFPDTKIVNTICLSSLERQNELHSLCQQVDAIIVVGGKNSANTKRLYELSCSYKKKTYWICHASELNIDELKVFNIIGITAGASTSQKSIDEVLELCKNI